MGSKELAHVIAAILLLFVISGFAAGLVGDTELMIQILIFAGLIVLVHVLVKKVVAFGFDSAVEHRIWHVKRVGFGERQRFKREVPFGVYVPLIFAVITLGILKVMTLLTFETRALKHRAAKRFGYYSYTSMTDWHNGLIGAFSIVGVLIVALMGYLMGFEFLAKMAAYYAFWNMMPLSNLDGNQILYGSRVLWAVLAFVSLLGALFALFLQV